MKENLIQTRAKLEQNEIAEIKKRIEEAKKKQVA